MLRFGSLNNLSKVPSNNILNLECYFINFKCQDFSTAPKWSNVSQRLQTVLVTQSCPTFRDPMECSPPGSSIHGIFQARILEWIAIPFSKESSPSRDWIQVSQTAGNSLRSEPPWFLQTAKYLFIPGKEKCYPRKEAYS